MTPIPPTPVATSITLSATSLNFSSLGETTQLRAWAKRTAELGVWNTPTLGALADLVPEAEVGEVMSRPGWQRCLTGRYADPIASRK
jgi:hypothetical protein